MTSPVAVTGAAGFIGRSLIVQLLSAQRPVRALLHRSPLGLSHPLLETVRGGLDDEAAVARLLAGAGSVVHLAGCVRGRNEADFRPVNADGVARVARLARDGDDAPRRFILMSSLAARAPHLSPYAASKRAGEARLAEVAGDGRLSWAVLRPPAVYGPEDRELMPLFRLMARGIVPMPGVAGARASLVHVGDLCRAIIRLLDSEARGSYTLHDGHPNGYDWEEMASIVESVAGRNRGWRLRIPGSFLHGVARANVAVASVLGRKPMLTPGKVNELRNPDWVCDNVEISRATGWQPSVSLRDGLSGLLDGAAHATRKGVSHVG